MVTATCPECRQTVVVDSGVAHICYAPSPLAAENAKLRAERDEALGKAADEKAKADTEEERWRDTVLKARQARDLADLQIEGLKNVLRSIEWRGDYLTSPAQFRCPDCGNEKGSGHTEDCDLGHALYGMFSAITAKQNDERKEV
jgi:predicted RNA-binding Zn-ribbon protein involved in translation (DUF1610 family)